MRLAALVHFAVPHRWAGSETVLHQIMRHAVESGHDVMTVTTSMRDVAYETEYEGVRVIAAKGRGAASRHVQQWGPDVVISHHQNAVYTVKAAKFRGWKSVVLVHSDMSVVAQSLAAGPDMVVPNSRWVAERWDGSGTGAVTQVLHPPLDCHRHQVDATGSRVTMVNLNRDKGGEIFHTLAERMPNVEFLGVEGGHGRQLRGVGRLPNAKVLRHGPDMRDVWADTRVVVMPSIYESYGLVGVEAGCSGIPCVANPTPGLRESLGPAGVFVDRDDVDGWERELRRLLEDEHHWTERSAVAKVRAETLVEQSGAELNGLVGSLELLPQIPEGRNA